MKGFGKYWMGFRLALSNELIYRANFLFGRARELIVFGALLFLFRTLPHGIGAYNQPRLLTYTLAAAFVSSLIFVYGMNGISMEIADGDLTNYLLRPIHYFGFWAARLMANRLLLLISGTLAVLILFFLFRATPFFWQTNFWMITESFALLVGSLCILQLLDFIGGALSFWTDRAYGPRFLITVLVQFLSGAYVAIDLLPSWIQTVLNATPFPSLIYAPVKAYLGDLSAAGFWHALLTQCFWIVLLTLFLQLLWQRGVKSYEAYGR